MIPARPWRCLGYQGVNGNEAGGAQCSYSGRYIELCSGVAKLSGQRLCGRAQVGLEHVAFFGDSIMICR